MPKAAATRTCTYTVSTIPMPRRSTSSLEPGCGPDAVATAPVTTSATQAGSPAHVTNRRSQRGPAAGARPSRRLHASSAAISGETEGREPEEKVRHHRERMEVERDRDPAHRDLRDRDEKRPERRPASPARQSLGLGAMRGG